MQQAGQMAEQVRQQRQPVSPDNPMLQWQAMVSDQIIAALGRLSRGAMSSGGADLPGGVQLAGAAGHGRTGRIGRATAPRALVMTPSTALSFSSASPKSRHGWPRAARARRHPGTGLCRHGGRGGGRAHFNELRQIRAENAGMPLQEFKQTLREQYFTLLLDREGALAAIPGMVPDDPALRARLVQALRRTVEAAGPVTGERGQRLERVETLLGGARPAARSRRTARKAA
jgi:hypothetical protein